MFVASKCQAKVRSHDMPVESAVLREGSSLNQCYGHQ